MTDAELRNQPKSVREEFEKIRDADVDGNELIVALKGELKDARATSKASNEQHDYIRSIIGSLQGEIEKARSEIEEIDGVRADVVAQCLISGNDFSADDDLLARRAELERRINRLTISWPSLERRRKAKYRDVEVASHPLMNLENKIEHLRDVLKLQEARRRHGLR